MTNKSFERARKELDVLESDLRESAAVSAVTVSGTDRQGATEVLLDGERFEITFAPDWERRVSAGGLGASVSEALLAAVNARFGVGSVGYGDTTTIPVTPMNSQADTRVVRDFINKNSDVDDATFEIALDALLQRAREAARERQERWGPAGLANVHFAPDGSVNAIAFNEPAIAGRSAEEIAADVHAAVRSGQQLLTKELSFYPEEQG